SSRPDPPRSAVLSLSLPDALPILASNVPHVVDTLLMLPRGIDALDARLIRALCETPRAGVMELARRLGVARGTVQARLDKLQQRDRKSTRLNSSHVKNSYAVVGLK